jgi:hypothetical protein
MQTPEGKAETARMRAEYAADNSKEAKAARKEQRQADFDTISRGIKWLRGSGLRRRKR